MKQEFYLLEEAALAAKVLHYITGRPVEINRLSQEEIEAGDWYTCEWSLESSVNYKAALFTLRFDLPPPPKKPDWWDDAKNYFENNILTEGDQEYFFKLIRIARALRFRREAGEDIKNINQRDSCRFEYAFDKWRRLREEEHQREIQADWEDAERLAVDLASDPYYQEDMRNAKIANFMSEQAEASDSSEEYSERLKEWGEFWDGKRD